MTFIIENTGARGQELEEECMAAPGGSRLREAPWLSFPFITNPVKSLGGECQKVEQEEQKQTSTLFV